MSSPAGAGGGLAGPVMPVAAASSSICWSRWVGVGAGGGLTGAATGGGAIGVTGSGGSGGGAIFTDGAASGGVCLAAGRVRKK